jgi:hypothetical protein
MVPLILVKISSKNIMRVVAELKNLESEAGKHIIVRNLHRILDIRILDIDVQNGRLIFLYARPIALEMVRRELLRLGYPVQSYKFQGQLPMLNKSGHASGEMASA